MPRKAFMLILIAGALILAMVACDIPGMAPDLAAQYYPSHTAAVRTLEAMMTANAERATEAATGQPAPPEGASASGPSQGTTIAQNPDGSVTYSDPDAGFEVTAPAGWLTVRLASPEYEAALTAAAKDADLLGFLDGLKDDDPQEHRLASFGRKPEYLKLGFIPEISIHWDPTANGFLEDDLRTSIRELETDPEFPGLRVISSQVITTDPNKVAVGLMGANWTYRDDADNSLPIYLKGGVFQGRNGMLVIMLITLKDSRDIVEPDFDAMIASIKSLR